MSAKMLACILAQKEETVQLMIKGSIVFFSALAKLAGAKERVPRF
jgi:hypothetical protein